MYDDIEKIREREEEEKDQNSKLGAAGMMAFVAGAALLATGILSGTFPDILPQLTEFLTRAALPIIGFGALGYGFFKTMKLAFRQKELNFPALNVYRKTKPVSAPEMGEMPRTRTQTQANNRYRAATNATATRTYRRTNQRNGLRRSRANRVFSGVAGGIAEYTGVSAALIRFAFIASLFMTSGMSIFVYLLLSIVLPANYDSYQEETSAQQPS
ncbi:MAG: hypothetical protein OHK0039_36220 [Bacteroidia bacterium]